MKTYATALVLLALCALTPAAFAAEKAPVTSTRALPAWMAAPRSVGFQDMCQGNCEITCDSGAEFYYYTPSYACCYRAYTTCPDGSNANGGEWWPDYCGGEALFC